MKTETDLNKRWEEGVPHHPRAVALYKQLAEADYVLGGDAFNFKAGGDGDNGEHLMYLLDVIFEAEDNGEIAQLEALLKRRSHS